MKAIQKSLQSLIAMLIASVALAQTMPAAREVMIDIEPQPIVDALNDWARQTGLQLIVPGESGTGDLVSRAVNGKYTPRAALDELLVGMPLTYTFINERTVVIEDDARLARSRPDMDALQSAGPDRAQ